MNEQQNLNVECAIMGIDARLTFRHLRQIISYTLFGKPQTALPSLEAYCGNRKIVTEADADIQPIPVKHITGGVKAHTDYDAEFFPQNSVRISWTQRCRAFLSGDEQPVIQVVKVDNLYFVESGYEVVSVARILGYAYLDAHVIEIELESVQSTITEEDVMVGSGAGYQTIGSLTLGGEG